MCDIDPAPLFVEKAVPAEVTWDTLGSPLNRELDARLERILTAGGLPGGIFDMDDLPLFVCLCEKQNG